MYATICPFSGTFDEQWLTYKIGDHCIDQIQIGCIVNIPLRDEEVPWIVLSISADINSDIKLDKIKSILSIRYPESILSSEQIKLIQWIAEQYFCPIHVALQLFLPKNLRDKITKQKFLIEKTSSYSYSQNNISLSIEQDQAYRDIQEIDQKNILLYGITGSGKTQIYMKLIADILKTWKQSLLLIPEIVLNHQVAQKIQSIFWDEVIILNSTVAEAKKTQYWTDIYHGNAKIIIGTRSALFYPYNNLGIIIIDEEHDQSYISDNSPRYHSIDIAKKISKQYNIPFLMWSGTPSIQQMYRAIQWDIWLIQMLKKYK